MKIKTYVTWVVLLLNLALIAEAWSYGQGIITHPATVNTKIVSTEFIGVVRDGKGVGFQARYMQKLTRELKLDGGFGISGGDRANRFFVSGDYMLFPDYGMQPRISARGYYENAKEFDARRHILGVSPTVSKGFSFWGREGYPFIAIPLELNLNTRDSSYRGVARLAVGYSMKFATQEYKKFLASFEANLNLTNSFSGFLVGISYTL